MASVSTIAEMMTLFGILWNKELTPNLLDLYHTYLMDLDDDELLLAATACVGVNRFFPTPADILEKAGKKLGTEAAWSLVMRADRMSDLPRAVQAAVRNVGGMKSIREGNYNTVYRNFQRAYPEIASDTEREERAKDATLLPRVRELIARLKGTKRPALPDVGNGLPHADD